MQSNTPSWPMGLTLFPHASLPNGNQPATAATTTTTTATTSTPNAHQPPPLPPQLPPAQPNGTGPNLPPWNQLDVLSVLSQTPSHVPPAPVPPTTAGSLLDPMRYTQPQPQPQLPPQPHPPTTTTTTTTPPPPPAPTNHGSGYGLFPASHPHPHPHHPDALSASGPTYASRPPPSHAATAPTPAPAFGANMTDPCLAGSAADFHPHLHLHHHPHPASAPFGPAIPHHAIPAPPTAPIAAHAPAQTGVPLSSSHHPTAIHGGPPGPPAAPWESSFDSHAGPGPGSSLPPSLPLPPTKSENHEVSSSSSFPTPWSAPHWSEQPPALPSLPQAFQQEQQQQQQQPSGSPSLFASNQAPAAESLMPFQQQSPHPTASSDNHQHGEVASSSTRTIDHLLAPTSPDPKGSKTKSSATKSRTGRRQNSACDACRASKKGCDLQVQVTYNDIGVSVKPLLKCSTCKRRGIECTTHEVHLIKSANGCFRPRGSMSETAQARLAALSTSLSHSINARPGSSALGPFARRRAAGFPRFSPPTGSGWIGGQSIPSVLLKPEAAQHQAAEEVAKTSSEDGLALTSTSPQQPFQGQGQGQEASWDTAASISLFEQLQALASVPGTSRTLASINQSSMSGTLISRTLSLYSSIMEGPMTLWLSHEWSDVKPVFAVEEIRRRLTLAGSQPPLSSSSSSSAPISPQRYFDHHDRFGVLDESMSNQDFNPPHHDGAAEKLLNVLKDAKASWAQWTSQGSNMGIGLADARGTDSSAPGSAPNLVFVATILDAAFETDIDPSQTGRNLKSSWAQRSRCRTWNEINEAVKAVLTAFGAQYLTSATMPSQTSGMAPLHLLAQRATWQRARDLLFSLASAPSFRVAFAFMLFSSIPPPFNANVASRATTDNPDTDPDPDLSILPDENEGDEYLSDRASQDCRFAADRGVKLMEQLVVRARKLCTIMSAHKHRMDPNIDPHSPLPSPHQQHPSSSSSFSCSSSTATQHGIQPVSPISTCLTSTLLGLLETMSFFALILDSGFAMSHCEQPFMSMSFAEQCIDAAARYQGLEYFSTNAPQLGFVQNATASSASLVENLNRAHLSDELPSSSNNLPSTTTTSNDGPSDSVASTSRNDSSQHEASSTALARAKAVASHGGQDLMLSIKWANALKIFLWRSVSVLQEMAHAGSAKAREAHAAAILGVDIVRRHFGTFGQLVEASIGAYPLLDQAAQMMLYYLVLHSTLGTFHLLDALDDLSAIHPSWDLDGITSPTERRMTVAMSTGLVAKISVAMRRAEQERQRGASPRQPGTTSTQHFTPTKAPSIWNHPMLFMAFDAFLHASLFSARVWADQLSVESHVPHIKPQVVPDAPPHPSEPPEQARLCVPYHDASSTRANLVACTSALNDLTRHVPSLLSWRNARRVTEVQTELRRLDALWKELNQG